MGAGGHIDYVFEGNDSSDIPARDPKQVFDNQCLRMNPGGGGLDEDLGRMNSKGSGGAVLEEA